MRIFFALAFLLLFSCSSPDNSKEKLPKNPPTPTPSEKVVQTETVIDLAEFGKNDFPIPQVRKTGKDIDTLHYGKFIAILDKLNEDVTIYQEGLDLNEKPFFGIALHWPELLEMNWFFKGIYKDYIIIDEGTSASGRALYLRDINTMKTWQFAYSEYAKIKNDKLYFFTPVDDKSVVPSTVTCPPEFDYTRFERCMIFDFKSKELKQTNQFICLYDE